MLDKIKIIFISFLILACLWPQNLTAVAQSPAIVISELQTGGSGTGTAAHEFIELYNNSSTDIDIVGWKLVYTTSTDSSPKEIIIFNGSFRANSYILLVSSAYPVPEEMVPDAAFEYNGGLASTGGHVKLFNASGSLVDTLGWGTASAAEAVGAPVPAGGSSLSRNVSNGILVDSDNNSQDFVVSSVPSPQGGGLGSVIVPPPVDQCLNLDDIQLEVPLGYQKIGDDCVVQEPEPEPQEYSPVFITELLPNPASPKLDDEDEFIELYNPNDETVSLKDYVLETGSSFQYQYIFPELQIPGHTYMAVYASETSLVLSNTSSQARIKTPDAEIVDLVPGYNDIGEDEAWALIGNSWQITNQPTPFAENKSSLSPEEGGMGGGLAPCPTGKYRNPDTNRCKKIDDGNTLKPCLPNQYRNPETNRCRKIGSTTTLLKPCSANQYRSAQTNRCRNISAGSTNLKPCRNDQYRNPETNRCKKSGSTSTSLKACKQGYARNPETNRCRKVAGVYTNRPLDQVASVAANPVNGLAIGIVASLVGAYSVFEYRHELGESWRKFRKHK